jgi:hypothetical protein
MSFNITLPKITASNPNEQMRQMQSYIYQLAEQLNWALGTLESSSGGNVSPAIKMENGSEVSQKDAENTFNSIKALIIKSADIVNAFYEEMNDKFSGSYVAQSDFGTFTELTEQAINTNSTAITNIFKSMQEIITDIEGLEHKLIEVNAHIRSGLLYHDDEGVPIYGLEIGQVNTIDEVEVFNKYARFTSDRLSFYDKNDTEVAYISDYKLYITNAQITGTLTLGRYELDTSDGLAFKWI